MFTIHLIHDLTRETQIEASASSTKRKEQAMDKENIRAVWHSNLQNLPPFSWARVESFVKINSEVQVTSERGYKFFLEGYIHDFQGELRGRYCNILGSRRPDGQ